MASQQEQVVPAQTGAGETQTKELRAEQTDYMCQCGAIHGTVRSVRRDHDEERRENTADDRLRAGCHISRRTVLRQRVRHTVREDEVCQPL